MTKPVLATKPVPKPAEINPSLDRPEDVAGDGSRSERRGSPGLNTTLAYLVWGAALFVPIGTGIFWSAVWYMKSEELAGKVVGLEQQVKEVKELKSGLEASERENKGLRKLIQSGNPSKLKQQAAAAGAKQAALQKELREAERKAESLRDQASRAPLLSEIERLKEQIKAGQEKTDLLVRLTEAQVNMERVGEKVIDLQAEREKLQEENRKLHEDLHQKPSGAPGVVPPGDVPHSGATQTPIAPPPSPASAQQPEAGQASTAEVPSAPPEISLKMTPSPESKPQDTSAEKGMPVAADPYPSGQ